MPRVPVTLSADEQRRLKAYLEATSKSSMANFFFRCAFEKVKAFEEHEEALQIRRLAVGSN